MLDTTIVVLSPNDVLRQIERGALLIDIRTPRLFAKLRLAGSISIAGARFGFPIFAGDRIAPRTRVIVVADTPVTGQIAADELIQMDCRVIGVFASQPNTWALRGLKTAQSPMIAPKDLLAYMAQHPNLEIIDIREPVEQAQYPFPLATRSLPFSTWPEAWGDLDRTVPFILVSGNDERSILALVHTIGQGYDKGGYLVGGVHRHIHGDHVDLKAIARTTAGHGTFI